MSAFRCDAGTVTPVRCTHYPWNAASMCCGFAVIRRPANCASITVLTVLSYFYLRPGYTRIHGVSGVASRGDTLRIQWDGNTWNYTQSTVSTTVSTVGLVMYPEARDMRFVMYPKYPCLELPSISVWLVWIRHKTRPRKYMNLIH